MELGISLYPEQESFEEMTQYIKTASKAGFRKIFTSMFSVPGEKDEVIAYFTKLCTLAHEHHMEVCADVNAMMFQKFDATERDLSVFQRIGLDELRMDFCFGDERDVVLVENKEGIKLQFSAFMVDLIKPILEQAKHTTVTVCHNFYPERYTGVPKKEFTRINKIWNAYDNAIVAAFISSNTKGAHGPWPVYNGLPTIEDHRGRPINFQIRELAAMGTEVVYFGNAFASEEELIEAATAAKSVPTASEETEFEKMLRPLMPNIGHKQVIFQIEEEAGLNEVERKVLYEFKKHCELGDQSDYMIRSRITRTIYGKQSIPLRVVDKPYFTKGDVLIVNDELKHYCGELQICLKDMENDGQRNLVGRLNDDEQQLIDQLEPGAYFMFQ